MNVRATPRTQDTALIDAEGPANISSWFLTINTNRREDNYLLRASLAEILDNAIQSAISDVEEFATRALSYSIPEGTFPGGGQRWVPTDEKFPLLIDSIEADEVAIEEGTKKGYIHAHFTLTIMHHSRIHLYKPGLIRMLLEQMTENGESLFESHNITNLYVHWIVIRDKISAYNIARYKEKTRGTANEVLFTRRRHQHRIGETPELEQVVQVQDVPDEEEQPLQDNRRRQRRRPYQIPEGFVPRRSRRLQGLPPE